SRSVELRQPRRPADEHGEERAILPAPVGRGRAENLGEGLPIGRAQARRMLEEQHMAARLRPGQVGEAVFERIPVASEPGGKFERRRDPAEQRVLAGGAAQLDARDPQVAAARRLEDVLDVRGGIHGGFRGVAQPREELAHLFEDALERAIVIARVVQRTIAARDDPARAAILRSGRSHRVFAIPAALARGQPLFAIAEGRAVACVGKRPALPYQSDRLERFLWEVLLFYAFGKTEDAERKDGQEKLCKQPHCGEALRSRICSSRSWRSVAAEGAPVSMSWPRCVFGKAITSRIASTPAMSATMRSK